MEISLYIFLKLIILYEDVYGNRCKYALFARNTKKRLTE